MWDRSEHHHERTAPVQPRPMFWDVVSLLMFAASFAAILYASWLH